MVQDKSRLYTYIVMIAAMLQPMLPKFGEPYDIMLTGLFVITAGVFTLLKQRVSIEINKKAELFTWVLVAIAAFGGINDLLQHLHEWNPVYLSEKVQNILSKTIVSLIAILNIVSKTFFPTDEGKSIAQQKVGLKQTQKLK